MKGLSATIAANAGKDRTAVFDLDHTILRGDIGDRIFHFFDEQGLLQRVPIMAGLASGRITGTFATHQPGESSWELYQRALREASELRLPSAIGDTYAWMTVSMAGLTPREIRASTEEAWNRSELSIRPESLALIGELLTAEYEVWVVSATNIWSLQWVIEEALNPLLKNLVGQTIARPYVQGMRVFLTAPSDFPEARAQLTSRLCHPCTTFAGKAQLLQERLLSAPQIVCGDSPNDEAMLRLAHHRVVVDRPEHREWAEKVAADAAADGALFYTLHPSAKSVRVSPSIRTEAPVEAAY